LVRGMTHGTMMRNEIYDFARIGTFLERADNTARILDVKYYVLLPSSRAVGSALDNVQWESILRSVSARGGFRMEYGAEAGPKDITHFLILDKRLPRSLVFCTSKLRDNLRYLDAGQVTPTEALKKVDHCCASISRTISRQSSNTGCTSSSRISSPISPISRTRSRSTTGSTSDPMRLKIHHSTHYRFTDPVTFGLQQLRKTPKTSDIQSVLDWETEVAGGRKELVFVDHHRNVTELVSFDRDTTEVIVSSRGEVVVNPSSGVVGPHLGPAPLWLYRRPTARTTARSGVRALVRKLPAGGTLDQMHALSSLIHETVAFEVGSSEPTWSAEEAIESGRGVCQDHAHVFLACARELGVPARYISGYLMLDDAIAQEAMHAWAEAFIDGLGWVGFDVSNGISPDARYVRVATGLDYSDAAPVSGTRIGGAGEVLEVRIDVAQQ
jgi:transglutaminase-like putative cysteine protease